jgi:RNA-directed DNA polymerase
MSPLELPRLWYLDGRKMALWSEPSRRRLRRETRTISQILLPHIPRSCTHVRGHGGVKGALRQIQRRMSKAKFVARFDIAAYYTSMRHDVIEALVAATDLDAHQRGLIADYLALPDMRGRAGGAWSRVVGCRLCSGRST